LRAEAEDTFACLTTREDKRMGHVNCIPICPKFPWRAQHSPGSMPSDNATVGEFFEFSLESCENIANRLRTLGDEYVSDVKVSITLPPAKILAYLRIGEGMVDQVPEAEA